MVAPSVLQATTLAVLREVREAKTYRPLYTQGAWVSFAEKLTPGRRPYQRGPLKLYMRTDGLFVVIDDRRPMGDQERAKEATEGDGADALDRLADAEGIRYDEEPDGPPLYGAR